MVSGERQVIKQQQEGRHTRSSATETSSVVPSWSARRKYSSKNACTNVWVPITSSHFVHSRRIFGSLNSKI